MIAKKFYSLNPGDEFKLNRVRDKRIFRREEEGATTIKDVDGNPSRHDYKIYPSMTSTVWVDE